MGVWIEIIPDPIKYSFAMSLPSWECGLKSTFNADIIFPPPVTPFMGVWIEERGIELHRCVFRAPLYYKKKKKKKKKKIVVCHSLHGSVD